MLRAVLVASFVAFFAAGCERAGYESGVSAEDVSRYAELPLARKSHNPKLREELARLISERATPTLLTRPLDYGWNRGDTASTEQLPDSSAALEQVFPEKKRWLLGKRLARVYPPDRFQFRLKKLQTAHSLANEFAQQREAFRKFVAQPDHDFRLDHTRGLGVDTSFVDAALIGNRLEALHAAGLLDNGDPQSASQSLEVLLRMAQLLAREPHLVSRITAAQLRGEALRVLEAIAEHPYSTVDTLQVLLTQVEHQLANWTADSQVWIGERAQGLHTYELVRDGYLLSLLQYDEIRKYSDEIGIEQLGEQVTQNIDDDEVFYLTSMRRVIESCEQPFFRRRPVFQRIRKQIAASRDTTLYPFVADQLLLSELETAHRWQALDWARCQAWRLALATAVGTGIPEAPVNPLTGLRFILELRSDRVIVDAIDPQQGERPVIVKRMTVSRRPTNSQSMDPRNRL